MSSFFGFKFFRSGEIDPGLGYRESGAVVARASLPEFATRKVVNSNDRYSANICRYLSRPLSRLDVWKFSGRIRPSRVMSPASALIRGLR